MSHQEISTRIRDLNRLTSKNPGKSAEYSQQALALALETDDPVLIAESHTILGTCYSIRGEVELTLFHLQEACTLFQSIPLQQQDRAFICTIHTAYGIIYDDLGQLLDARWHHKQALDLAYEIDYSYGQQRSLLNLGYIHSRLGMGTEAIDWLSQAVRHPYRDRRLLACAQDHLADAFESQAQWEVALTHRLNALEIVGDDETFYRIRYYHKLIFVQLKLGDIEAAWESIHAVQAQFAKGEEDSGDWADHYQALSQIYLYEKQYDKAHQLCLKSIQFSQKLGATSRVLEVYILLGEIALGRGDYQQSLTILQQIKVQELAVPAQKALYEVMIKACRALGQWQQVVVFMNQRQTLISEELVNLHTLYQLQKEVHKTKFIQHQNQRLNEKNEQLRALHQEKDEIMRIVAHDLRSPITVLLLSLELIQRSQTNIINPELDAKLSLCLESIERMQGIVSQLMMTGKIEAQDLPPKVEPNLILPLVERIRKHHLALATAKQQQILLTNTTRATTQVLADTAHLEQVITNLLSNAIKYSPTNSNIIIRIYNCDPEQVQVDIEDRGPGLSGADKQRLFQKYARLSAKPTGGEDSTGLGLYIAKKLTQSMGGNIIASSAGKGKGSTFSVVLPEVV